jgi:hypothetical protein
MCLFIYLSKISVPSGEHTTMLETTGRKDIFEKTNGRSVRGGNGGNLIKIRPKPTKHGLVLFLSSHLPVIIILSLDRYPSHLVAPRPSSSIDLISNNSPPRHVATVAL